MEPKLFRGCRGAPTTRWDSAVRHYMAMNSLELTDAIQRAGWKQWEAMKKNQSGGRGTLCEFFKGQGKSPTSKAHLENKTHN